MKNVIGLKSVFLVSMFSLMSCGQQSHQFLKSIKLTPYTVNSNVYAELYSELDFGNMQVPSVSYAVKHPDQNYDIGQVNITAIAGGKTGLDIKVNLTNITSVRSSRPILPNGALIPLIGGNEALDIKIGGTQAHVYAAIFDNAAALGISVPVGAFDALGKSVGTTSLFPNFNIGGVIGAAGVFTSSEANKSGFGVFADISAVLGTMKQSASSKAGTLLALSVSGSGYGKLNYNQIKPSSSVEKALNNKLYELSRNRTVLRVVR